MSGAKLPERIETPEGYVIGIDEAEPGSRDHSSAAWTREVPAGYTEVCAVLTVRGDPSIFNEVMRRYTAHEKLSADRAALLAALEPFAREACYYNEPGQYGGDGCGGAEPECHPCYARAAIRAAREGGGK